MNKNILLFCILLLMMNRHAAFSQEEKNPYPSVENLAPNWWNELTENKEKQDANLQAFRSNLEKIPKTMDEADQPKASSLINEIETNLKAYLLAKQQKIEPQPSLSPIIGSYTLDEFIQLAGKKNQLKSQIEIYSDKLEQLDNSIKKSNGVLDKHWVSYLRMKSPSSEKTLIGLEIISDQIKLEIKNENKRRLQARLEALSNGLAHFEKEIEQGRGNLNLGNFDETDWDAKIEKGEEAFQQALYQLSHAYANMNLSFDDTPISQSKRSLQDIQLNKLACQEEIEIASLLIIEMKREFIRLQLHPKTVSALRSGELVQEWEKALNTLENKLKGHFNFLREQQESLRTVYLQEKSLSEEKQKEVESLFRQQIADIQTLFSIVQKLENQINTAKFIFDEYEKLAQTKTNFFMLALLSIWNFASQAWEAISSWIFYTLFKVAGIPITFFSLLEIILIFGAALLLSKFIRSGLQELGRHKMIIEESAFYTLGRLIHYAILLLALLFALTNLGFDFTTLALIAGALSVGIGFGLQSLVKDFINGLSILFSRNIRVGDIIELKDQFIGKVKAINVLNTIVEHADGNDLIVPNSEILGSIVNNYTLSNPFRRLHIPFSIEYGIDKKHITEIVQQAAYKVPYTVKNMPGIPEPEVCITGYSDNGINVELIVWINQRISLSTAPLSAYYWELDNAFQENGINLPTQQINVACRIMNQDGQEKNLSDKSS